MELSDADMFTYKIDTKGSTNRKQHNFINNATNTDLYSSLVIRIFNVMLYTLVTF